MAVPYDWTGIALPPGYNDTVTLPPKPAYGYPTDNSTVTPYTPASWGANLAGNVANPAKAAAIAGVKAVASKAPAVTSKAGTAVQSFGISGGGYRLPTVATTTSGTKSTGNLNPMVNNQARIMGGYTDAATNEMRMKQAAAESLLRSQIAKLNGDPQWQAARTMAMQAAQNPGINPALLAQMRGRAAASAAANTAAGARGIMAQIARGNIRGAGAADAMQMTKNRGAVSAQQQGVGIDQWAAEKEQSNKAQALQQLVSILQGQNASEAGLTGQLASTMTGYNPLQWLSQINGIMSPVGALGQAAGLRGLA